MEKIKLLLYLIGFMKGSITLTFTCLIILISNSIYGQWTNIQTGQLNSFYRVDFLNSNTGYLYNDIGRILKSTNGGLNWFLAGTNGIYGPIDMKFNDVNTGWVVGHDGGGNGMISKTTNGGANWISTDIQDTVYLYSIFWINSQSGWVSGSEGKLLKTTNSGNNWITQNSGTPWNLKDISFINENTGWVVGEFGTVKKTTNGGNNWDIYSLGTTRDLYCIFFSNSETGWIGGESGFLRKTTNSGVDWQSQSIGSSNLIRRIKFISSDSGWIASNYGLLRSNVMKTTNGGTNWYSTLNLGFEDMIQDIDFINQTGWAAGDSGIFNAKLFKTTNGGITAFESVSHFIPGNFYLTQNYPNPFNPSTEIKFEIPIKSFANLVVYNLLGKEITTLVSEEVIPGTYLVNWDASNLPSGVYYYTLSSGDYIETKKMVLIK